MRNFLAGLALLVLVVVEWAVVAYVCGRKVWMIQDVQHFMRLLLPGIW